MSVAVVMVVRADAPSAQRAIGSVLEYVDEVLVLDVGLDPREADRLRSSGARLVEGTWCSDAGTVRNAALAASGADWNLILEAEEWLEAGGAQLARLAALPGEHIGLAQIVHDLDQVRVPVALSARLVPRGVQFSGAITDEVDSDLPRLQTELVIGADNAQTGRWRQDRALLEAALLQGLAVRPDDPGMLHQLAADQRLAGRVEDAADTYAKALALTPLAAPGRHAVVTGALEAFTAAGRFREAVALTDAEMPTWQHSPDFNFLLGDLFFELLLATPALADQLAPLIATSWRRCLELGDRSDLAGSVHGRGSFLAAQNLYVLALTVGEESEAQVWWERAGQLRLDAVRQGGPRLLG
ncbi:glycosyltransferase family protein [Gephyromycinifex aptenodytis]|uniref:hypothetical protein n=1 Tax=Gephyromycinifex aptenodytis TaxID=2716227 RepID=UPI0014473B79|nr:hypothetical protein [Gephyromycinifex aptenodytis]